MIDESVLFDLLSDETRRRILALLVKEEELCVCELFHALDMAQPKVSRHLALMRESGLVTMRRDGTWIYYRIEPRIPAWTRQVIELMTRAGGIAIVLKEDRARLASMPNRPARCCA